MDTENLATFFQVWLSQEDWATDKHKFYRSLGHAVHSGAASPDGEALIAAVQRAYQQQHGEHGSDKLRLQWYCEATRCVADYLRATQ